MSSFKYHSLNNFFLNFICFHGLHYVKISIIFMMLKTLSCADLFSRPLCWSIYWWIMWFLCGFEYIAKNHHRVYCNSDWNLCWHSRKCQGKVREFFPGNPEVVSVYYQTQHWFTFKEKISIDFFPHWNRCSYSNLDLWSHHMVQKRVIQQFSIGKKTQIATSSIKDAGNIVVFRV